MSKYSKYIHYKCTDHDAQLYKMNTCGKSASKPRYRMLMRAQNITNNLWSPSHFIPCKCSVVNVLYLYHLILTLFIFNLMLNDTSVS